MSPSGPAGRTFMDFAAVHESPVGTSRHLVRFSDMSEVGVDRK